jgi:tetratricopeptide (TPR) repeat protein
MSETEGEQVEHLLKGRPARSAAAAAISSSQLAWIGILFLLLVGFSGYQAILYDEYDQLLNVLFSVGTVVVVLWATVHAQRSSRNVRQRLKQERAGAFTDLTGRVTDVGVEYVFGAYPIRYAWDDFVGCRIAEDAAVLYVDYPKKVNFLAASLFDDPDQWQAVRALLSANVPKLTRLPRLQARRTSQRMNHLESGIRALDQQSWQRALDEFDAALRFDPSDGQALQGRMVAAVALRDFERALTAVEDVVALGPPDATTRRMRMTVMLNLERYDEAMDDLDWLLQKEPQDGDLLRDRGFAWIKLEQYERALEDTTAAIELNPEDFVALSNRGFIFIRQQRYQDAAADLENAIRLEPKFERAHELLAEAKRQGETRELA